MYLRRIIVAVWPSHFNPTSSPIVRGFKFHSSSRQPGESVAVSVSQLRALSGHCDLNDTLEEICRDRIDCGINDDTIQRRLLYSKRRTDFKKVAEVALIIEMAPRDVKELLKPLSSREQRLD